ncbi:M20/M25/M40 family metallo-hydrolase [Mycobacterium tuberculosis]
MRCGSVQYADPAGPGQDQYSGGAWRRCHGAPGRGGGPSAAARPWGAQVTVTRGEVGQPYAIEASGPVYDAARSAFRQAWGADPIDMGMGGSIPFIAEFAAAFPQATILVTGVEDPGTQAHSVNESLHLGVLERAATAEALLLAKLAAIPTGRAEA